MSDRLESDMLADSPHPRETTRLIGQDVAEQALLAAYQSGRIHHAWILGGPEGIGKATLAYRMAKFVLTNSDPSRIGSASDLSVPPEGHAARQVMSQAHVDLTVLRRLPNEKTKGFYSNIRVDDVRDVVRFLGSTAGAGGWRIAIIDSAEDLAREGANALLKVLEEPPPRVLFLMVSHQPARLLPTIRSRCRLLALEALGEADVIEAAAQARPDLSSEAIAAGAALAQGSVRRALTLADGEGVALHRSLTELLAKLPRIDVAAAHALADRCANKAGEENFALLLDFIDEWLHQRLLSERSEPAHRLARWAEVWEKARSAARDVEAYNLDRKPFVLSTLSMLAEASAA
ncbi:DNA polymerase III subunit delta' [Labrys miyagiensis]|uniref:DNA polymerase III subunit delta n=1 Tax=Labrys miyagiensis TaxID=346912 RepID=A0ABQ6CJF1_9HYPH|nr:DNA polymerase III subunit delta' [Labrys miyagiensis]GLS20300.1 DNA polymerase III subunit delta' [Labrys miyagiensis]